MGECGKCQAGARKMHICVIFQGTWNWNAHMVCYPYFLNRYAGYLILKTWIQRSNTALGLIYPVFPIVPRAPSQLTFSIFTCDELFILGISCVSAKIHFPPTHHLSYPVNPLGPKLHFLSSVILDPSEFWYPLFIIIYVPPLFFSFSSLHFVIIWLFI